MIVDLIDCDSGELIDRCSLASVLEINEELLDEKEEIEEALNLNGEYYTGGGAAQFIQIKKYVRESK